MNVRRLLPAVAVTLLLLPLARLGRAQMYSPPPQAYGVPPGAQMSQPNSQQVVPSAAPADTCPTYCDNCVSTPAWQFFGGALFLHPRNAGIEYAVPINGPIVSGQVPLQMGRTALVDPDYKTGFYLGAARSLGQCSSISAEYTNYANRANDSISTNAPLVLESMVVHPSSLDAASTWNSASAHEFIGFQLADIDYRHQVYGDACGSLTWLLGLRYANLRQSFNSDFESNTSATVASAVNFDGAGLRVGLETERQCFCGLFFYGKTSASFLGGEVRANYLQTSSTVSKPVADTTWKDSPFVSMLDGELGVGWARPGGHVRASVGYVISSWLNAVKPAPGVDLVTSSVRSGLEQGEANCQQRPACGPGRGACWDPAAPGAPPGRRPAAGW
ncbi:MAG: Lpg1974 family pore-forming outer membrane protein [Thermoguttaceae bacterium]